MATILCVDDEKPSLMVMEAALKKAGHDTVGVHNVEAALRVLERGGVDLIVSDYLMPGATGRDLLEAMRSEGYRAPLIMVTGHASIEHAVESIKAGAVDYITKPVRAEQLALAVEQGLEVDRLRRENARLKEEVSEYRVRREIIGESDALKRILETIRVVAPGRTTVLLQGESGTGKELLARAIHDLSDRRDEAFVSINSAAMPEHLVESLLFGHEKGAFTGAVRQVKGAFERADGGTLLLDEVGEMRLDLQAKLLRVLQEQEFERVGGTATVGVDVRVVAVTNRDLAAEVEKGSFREDLYYRLSVVPLRVPPLRERREDIPALVQHFATRAAEDRGTPPPRVLPETLEMLQSHDWPGNVRELAHAVERAVVLSGSDVLAPRAFEWTRFGLAPTAEAGPAPAGAPAAEGDGGRGEEPDGPLPVRLFGFDLKEAEARLIDAALQATGQNRTRAAGLLGISPRTLRNKLNKPGE